MLFRYWKAAAVFCCLMHADSFCQSLKPGLSGMAPSKWLTFRNTHAPGKVYSFPNAGSRRYTHEEYFARVWLPVVHSERVTVLMGPSYRTEQFELKTTGENPISRMSNWNLRSYALDVNAVVRLDSSSWLIATSHFNKSGNTAELSFRQIPVNYTLSASYLRKKSLNKELGFGILFNQSYKLTILPVLIYNHNYAENAGFEIMLPKKIAWRRNLSANDILYLKAESVTRTYYTNHWASEVPDVCRRVDVDMAVTYNRKLGSMIGMEVSAGYRKNLSTRLIEGAVPLRTSGFAMTFDLYVQPPKFKGKK
ncbi:hypothetical protein [Dyadobacter sediminis]|nr:hypothetical protein [Dyadobacter sediminis]